MKSLFLIVAALTAAATSLMAQQQFTEKIDVNVVNVDVSVTSHGQPVRGLTQRDFIVLEDGVPQAVTNFYAVDTAAPADSAATSVSAPAAAINPAGDERFRRKVLVIVDNMNTSKINRDRALERLEKFIDDQFASGQYEWSIAVASERLMMVLPLTSDKQAIHTAISMVRGQATWQQFRATLSAQGSTGAQGGNDVTLSHIDDARGTNESPFASYEGHNVDPTVAYQSVLAQTESRMMSGGSIRAVRDAVRAFSTTSGRKLVLLLTGGMLEDTDVQLDQIPANAPGGAFMRASEAARNAVILRDLLIHEANASNVSVYVINPEGLSVSEAGRGASGSAMLWLANETGGAMLAGNYPEKSLSQFDTTSANFYSIGYRATHGDDAKYHRIQVKLRENRGYALHYRDGYASLSPDVQLVRTLLTPLAASMHTSSLPLTVSVGTPTGASGKMLLPVKATIPLRNLQFIPGAKGWDARVDLFVSVFDADGRNVGLQRFTTTAHALGDQSESAGELTHIATVKVNGGKPATIVVAVRDQLTDAVGMATRTVKF